MKKEELKMIEDLVKRQKNIIRREKLMEMEGNKEVYGYDRRVDIIIRRMRKKMEEDK